LERAAHIEDGGLLVGVFAVTRRKCTAFGFRVRFCVGFGCRGTGDAQLAARRAKERADACVRARSRGGVRVMGVVIDKRGSYATVAGLPVGLAVTAGVLFAGPLTGGAMNPARWFGSAIASGSYANFWIWIVGPLAGAIAAAFLYDAVMKPAKK